MKLNDKHWIVTKSLQDFKLLGEELAAKNPKIRIPDYITIHEEKLEMSSASKEEKTIMTQKCLEAYLRKLTYDS